MGAARFDLDTLLDTAATVTGALDIMLGRAGDDGAAPAWVKQRGWEGWLAGLADDALLHAEQHGLSVDTTMPDSLARFLTDVRRACVVPHLVTPSGRAEELHHAGAAKRQQVAAFVLACESRALHPSRVVDVGSGHGHLTRELARTWDAEALGLENNEALLEKARGMTMPGRVEYLHVNALETLPTAGLGDLWVGLHACGALGDTLVTHGARATVPVALVGCCPQKIPTAQRAGFHPATPALPRGALGLANVTPRSLGVEVDQAVDRAARLARLAVRLVLRRHGQDVAPGQEMAGLNRRVARHGPHILARAVFEHAGLPPPALEVVDAALCEAAPLQAAMRRWDLPRAALGRAVEVLLARDRAWVLANAGMTVDLGTFVEPEVSPRNLMVVARP